MQLQFREGIRRKRAPEESGSRQKHGPLNEFNYNKEKRALRKPGKGPNFLKYGRDERIRTSDPLHPMQMR